MQTTMDVYTDTPGAVDQEVRAYIYSLASALGGTGIDEDGAYVPGDDALAVLKDIKRWLKLYDEKLNRLDVARCLAEANVLKGDILEILSLWPEDEVQGKLMSKMALACMEVLVPLTWPLERSELQITTNHYQNTPYLQLAQIGYKREILEHPSTSILRTAIRVALPSIALPITERSQRDEGIIKLILYFLRNIALISAPTNLPVEWNENEVSRSATIEAFQAQDVFALLLTIASNIGEDFNTQDVVVLELLFHIVKGVNVEKLFLEDIELDEKNSKELKGLMDKEAAMLRAYSKNAPTRHNRFGTMIWVKRDDEKVSTVSGQDVLKDGQHTLTKMDQSKKWNKPKIRKKDQRTANHFDLPAPLTKSANKHLRSFVEEFLDSGFNPMFSHLRRAIERDADRVLESHQQQFLYLTGWFLQAERARKAAKKRQLRKQGIDALTAEADSYGLVASVLNQETFILLNKQMQEWLDHKQWLELDAGMRCFTQILMTVQEMSESSIDEDQEIADNIQNRIFYEETTHDRVLKILREYKDQNFSYLDACTDLTHVFLRMLERYSKENIDLQVRSRRRVRNKRKAKQAEQSTTQEEDQDSEAEDEVDAQRISRERKFDFNRFAAKFVTQPCVNTFVTFTTYYQDLTTDQLKRAHRYFYRVAFKQEMSVMLYRLDILALLHRIVNGPDGLNTASPAYKEWKELAKQIFRRFLKKMKERPGLAVEALFSKMSSTAFYLEHGYDKEAIVSASRAPADLEVKGEMPIAEQIAVAVAALASNDMSHVVFVENAILAIATERQAWEAANEAIMLEDGAESGMEHPKPPSSALIPDNEARRIALFRNARLRLLCRLAGLERQGESDDSHAKWMFPSGLSSSDLRTTAHIIATNRENPRDMWGEEDSMPAEEMLRKKYTTRVSENVFGSDDEADLDDADIDALVEEARALPTNAMTIRKPNAKPKKSRKRKSSDDEGEDDDGATSGRDDKDAQNRRKARLLADIAKRRKIKSSEFVHDSDDEENEQRDAEFFQNEETHRKDQARKIMEMLRAESTQRSKDKKSEKKSKIRRKLGESEKENATPVESEQDQDDLDDLLGPAASSSSPPKASHSALLSSDHEEDTPISSLPDVNVQKSAGPSIAFVEDDSDGEEDEDIEMLEVDASEDMSVNKLSTMRHVGEEPAAAAYDSNGESQPQSGLVSRRRRVVLDDSDDE